ncbi:MAG: permease [Planctomycetes bacterium]|nr:permease [Planctomycetota bacterium]
MRRVGASTVSLAFLAGLVALLALLAARQGGGPLVLAGLGSAGRLFLSVLPNLALGFLLAGFIQVLVPEDLVARHMGAGSGGRGLLVGTVIGALTPGGPFTHFPILASFLAKGAAVGPVVAYITSWALLGVFRIAIWELPILGPRLVLVRVAASCLLPPLVGLVSGLLHSRLSP